MPHQFYLYNTLNTHMTQHVGMKTNMQKIVSMETSKAKKKLSIHTTYPLRVTGGPILIYSSQQVRGGVNPRQVTGTKITADQKHRKGLSQIFQNLSW